MTPISLLHFLVALCWATIVFIAIAGLGAALLRLAGLRKASIALAAIAGLGLVIFLGGCLNLLHAISYAVRLAMVALGALAFLWTRPTILPTSSDIAPPPQRTTSPWVPVVLSLAALVFLVRFGATVHTEYYQQDDDYNFYLAAPVKMAALQHYAPDPFSERRVMSSLGGNYFLQSLILAELPVEDVQMADRALGLLLIVFVATGLGAVFRLHPLQRALLLLFLLLTPQLQFNLTFVILPYALFCGLVYLATNLDELASRPGLQALLIGATAATITSFKSTYLPHGILFCLVIALFRARYRGLTAGLKTILFASAACLIVLLPWMIASHAASNTWFYPLLGKGYQYSTYGLFLPPSAGNSLKIMIKVMAFNLPLLGVLVVEWFYSERDEQSRALVALTVAALVASVLVGIATGGDSVRRYNYPAIVAAILLLYVALSHKANLLPTRTRRVLEHLSAALCVCLAIYIGTNSWTHEYRQTFRCLHASLTDFHIEPQSTALAYTAMEQAIPTGPDGTVATLDFPFLLDFKSHDIAIADIPGAASLPPGWPARSDGDALAAYLLANHRRYLALTAFDLPKIEKGNTKAIDNPATTQWIRSESEIRISSFRLYDQLVHSRRHLYDDGNLIVLDLATRQSEPSL